ncbi:regulatory iron-sulfur-containing complex subunit RicT [Flectobacillus longus]|uniref:regulatory iron-sulfur-containing complex subunit RicT n=1 Tax=Flectobacillus longus TaxID=2984207 RepID=UPI00286E625D|nr:regulatory iron-sulfur-containing complex subunit RicT [Flectobacillus longus]
MGCKSCSTGSCGTRNNNGAVSGCKNNGACSTGGCNKMNVFDWLSNMEVPAFSKFNIIEVKFKGGRKEYFRNVNQIELYAGDPVIVDVPNGHHLGFVSLQGELVRLQMLKKSIKDDENVRVVYRKANEKDLEKHEQAIARDLPTMYRTREIIKELKLDMKLSDVEFQSDNTKAIFYYSSDDRVDFRELIKILASEFKVRVEMKQISLRQEAARVGGIGVCGRELCCSTWLTDFKNVTTSAARYQNLSLNPVKLSGQCGRLKCCLNYELETYMDALKDIPTIEKPLQTLKGEALLQKTDIFKRVMWFGYRGEESNWIPVTVDKVREVVELNEKGIQPQSLDVLENTPASLDLDKSTSGLNADLDKMDKKYSNNKKKPHNKSKNDKHQEVKSERKEYKHERKDSRLDVSDKKEKPVVVEKKTQQPQSNNPKGNNHKHQTNHNKNPQAKAQVQPASSAPKVNPSQGNNPNNPQGGQQAKQVQKPQQNNPQGASKNAKGNHNRPPHQHKNGKNDNNKPSQS